MPRSRCTPVLLTRPLKTNYLTNRDGPRLWNAKRRIKTSKGIKSAQAVQKIQGESLRRWYQDSKAAFIQEEEQAIDNTINEAGELEWWKLEEKHLTKFMSTHPILGKASPDVRSFIARSSHMLEKSTILQLLQNPAKYFSASANVPYALRRQIYFPDPKDTVTLMRTPHLGPRYAAFDVPLHFNKIDLRAYLRDVYNVDVLHIRSVVVQEKVKRSNPPNRYTQGHLYRPPSHKKMTVLLAKPFVYPEEIEDLSPWEHDSYWNEMKARIRENREDSDWGRLNPNYDHRKSIAVQAKELLEGKTKWAPTWQNFPQDIRAMQGLPPKTTEAQSGKQKQTQTSRRTKKRTTTKMSPEGV